MFRAWQGDGVYCGSDDELTRLEEDPLSVVPLAAVAGRLLINPAQATSIIRSAVDTYSLSEESIRRMLDLDAHVLHTRASKIVDSGSMRS
jgi:hypothetical protein